MKKLLIISFSEPYKNDLIIEDPPFIPRLDENMDIPYIIQAYCGKQKLKEYKDLAQGCMLKVLRIDHLITEELWIICVLLVTPEVYYHETATI